MVTRGAQVVWLPALDSEVIEELEKKQLPFDMARDGQVPKRRTFFRSVACAAAPLVVSWRRPNSATNTGQDVASGSAGPFGG